MDNFNGEKKSRSIGKGILFALLILIFIGAAIAYFLDFGKLPEDEAVVKEAQTIYRDVYRRHYPGDTDSTALPSPTPDPPQPTERAIRPEFLELMEIYDNDDIVGYINIPGTSVDYIVLQKRDDKNEFYLNNDIYKKPSGAGWIYLDYENDVFLEDPSMIIYGHNMSKDIMFHSLRYYVNLDYYEGHPLITFNTLYDDFTWEIFSVFITKTTFSYNIVNFKSRDAYYELASEVKRRARYDTGIEISPDDRILILSTCTSADPNSDERLVVAARLMRDESR